MSTKQQTLKAPISFSGKGLHTGVKVTMTVNPADAGTGIVFRRTDIEGQPQIQALCEFVVNFTASQRYTSLSLLRMVRTLLPTLLLADGMGSGMAAAQDSRMLITSLERFLRAGITIADALKAVSPALRLRSDGTRFTTLDALTVDLFTGRAESLKCGAAPSYLRMGGQWTVLTGKALPIGLAEEDALGEPVPLRLGHGDLCIFLVTGAAGRGHDDDRTALVMRIEKM